MNISKIISKFSSNDSKQDIPFFRGTYLILFILVTVHNLGKQQHELKQEERQKPKQIK